MIKTYHISIFGIVQGVGFRPFTKVTADRLGVTGTVSNKGSYVEIYAVGDEDKLLTFLKELRENAPERAMIMDIEHTVIDNIYNFSSFEIIESEKEYGDIFVSPDIATCDKCKAELFEKGNRRYLHPFINCTQCGPRVTILDGMPYDRERTSMKKFPMCPDCEKEYTSPDSRRFDAQPVCCNKCGPQVYILKDENIIYDSRSLSEDSDMITGGDAIKLARKYIMQGKVVAVKGIGGFHLCCDARNDDAIKRLRKLKSRPMKPFAVMLRDFETVKKQCIVLPGQEKILTGWQKPILLLERKKESDLSDALAPGNPTLGIFLPYAPVQMLLFDYPDGLDMTDALVMTSGNVSGAPISRNDENALNEIAAFTDLIISHNRDIRLRADDSVMDWVYEKPYMIRRSRGYAPLPIMVKTDMGTEKADKSKVVLAIGGELKNTFCINKNGLLYLSPYVGDMADIRTVQALKESVKRMCELLEAVPNVIISDKHPRYNTVAVAEELSKEMNIPLIRVQHHYAHILSCMAENDHDGRVIGLSFDGTGYGDDGTIWGGEILICDRTGYERAGHITPFMQTGGDLSSKEGWRIAARLIHDIQIADSDIVNESKDSDESGDSKFNESLCSEQEYKLLNKMADNGINSVMSTSLGRVFDAVSALLGIRRVSTFEGEASTALMFKALEYEKEHPDEIYEAEEFIIPDADDDIIIDTNYLFRYIYEGLRSGEDIGKLSFLFHKKLAELSIAACVQAADKYDIMTVCLSGGVFQNRLLLKLVKDGLEEKGFNVLIHALVPPNDGGIALGQSYYKI